MRILLAVAAAALLASCRGEPTPHDYQNNPPKHPVTSSSQTPTAHGMPGPGPEPSKGVQGPNVTPTRKTPQQAPVTTTQVPPRP